MQARRKTCWRPANASESFLENKPRQIAANPPLRAPALERTAESGSVIWFLLIAVALLGMLTMVLTRSGSSVDNAGDYERRALKASEIMRYGQSVQTAIQQLKQSGISENDISFEHGNPATYVNPNCTENACKIFHAGGAGLTYKLPVSANDGSDWVFTAKNLVGSASNPVGTGGFNTGNDLIMVLPHVTEQMCNQINKLVGIQGIPVDNSGIDLQPFDGSFLYTADISIVDSNSVIILSTGNPGAGILDGDPSPFELDNKPAGCYSDANDANQYYFYYTLLAR